MDKIKEAFGIDTNKDKVDNTNKNKIDDTIVHEHVVHKNFDEIQPVIERKIVQPHINHKTIVSQETVQNKPVHHNK